MLQKLKFNIEEMNNNCIGVSYTYYPKASGNNTVLAHIQGVADCKHEMWLQYNHPTDFLVQEIIEVQDGVYDAGLNFNHFIDDFTGHKVRNDVLKIKNDSTVVTYEDQRKPDYEWDFGDSISTYGVADNIEQVLEHIKCSIESDVPICVSFCTISKDEQPERDGWRWEKWGEYIGTQTPTCQYLADEELIDEVIVFEVHVLEEK